MFGVCCHLGFDMYTYIVFVNGCISTTHNWQTNRKPTLDCSHNPCFVVPFQRSFIKLFQSLIDISPKPKSEKILVLHMLLQCGGWSRVDTGQLIACRLLSGFIRKMFQGPSGTIREGPSGTNVLFASHLLCRFEQPYCW